MQHLFELIREANPSRHPGNLLRRIFKLGEEFGEIMEAYLNVTSANNGKGKTWDDIREEVVDVLIVAVDVALTPIDGEAVDLAEIVVDPEELEYEFAELFKDIGELASSWWEYNHLNSPARLRHVRELMRGAVLGVVQLVHIAMPDQPDLSDTQLAQQLEAEVIRKLAKWALNRDTGKVATDAE